MLDSWMIEKAKRPLIRLAERLVALGVKPDYVTFFGFGLGVISFILIATGSLGWGLFFIFLNRISDGLDGTLARLTQTSDRGAFLDISLDFLFYSLIPLGFAFYHPSQNALAAACVIFSFIGTGASFLAFAIVAAKRNIKSLSFPQKSFYYMGGLTEATETIAFFTISVLFPENFPIFAYSFAVLCLGTTFMRITYGWKTFGETS